MSVKKRRLARQEYAKNLATRTRVSADDTLQMEEKWVWSRYVVNGVTAFLGTFGLGACFLGSFGIDWNPYLVAVVLLFVSLYIAAIYYKFKNLGYLLFFLIYMRTILQYRQMANSGFATILNVVQTFLSYEIGLPAGNRYVESVDDSRMAVTICVIYIGCLFVVLLNIAIEEYMNVGDIVVVTLPLAQFGMLFGMQPSKPAFMLLLISWIFVLCMKRNFHYRQGKKKENKSSYYRYKRKKHQHQLVYFTDSRVNTQVILAVSGFLFVVITVVSLLVPSAISGNQWRERVVADIRYLVTNGFEDFLNRQGAGGVNGGKLGEVGTVRFDNQTDIILRMAPYKTERIYLKAYTGTNYTGRSWEPQEEQEWQKWRESDMSISAVEINDASFLTFLERKGEMSGEESGYYTGKVQITNVDANDKYLYLPYFFSLSKSSKDRSLSYSARYSVPQDDTILSQMTRVPDYETLYTDMDLSVQELDAILQEEREEEYYGLADRTMFTEDGGESDVTPLYLLRKDGSREGVAYLEKEISYDMKKRGTTKEMRKQKEQVYTYRFVPAMASENGVLYTGNIAGTLQELGSEVTGLTAQDLAGVNQSAPWLYDGREKNFWFYVILSKGRSRTYLGVPTQEGTMISSYAAGDVAMADGYQDSLTDSYPDLSVEVTYVVGKVNNVHQWYDFEESPYQALVNRKEVIDCDTSVNGYQFDEPESYDKYERGEIDMPVWNKGILSYESRANNLITAIGTINGEHYELADSLTDYAYRGYVLNHYLDIPEETREAVAEFCREYGISPEDDNVLEKVILALEEHCTYALNPGRTPGNEDFVAYFLQKQQKGFCVHFASAAAMIFRYLGIPARYCEGYAVDYVDALAATLVEDEKVDEWIDGYTKELGGTAVLDIEIPDANAHAWTEIYLRDYGWVPIDATPAAGIEQNFDSFWDEFDRDEDEEETQNQFLQTIGGRMMSIVTGRALAIIIFVVLPGLLLLFWAIKGIRVSRRYYRAWHTKDETRNLIGLYQYMAAVMAVTGNEQAAGVTYEEYGSRLVEAGYLSEEESRQLMADVEEAAFGKEPLEEEKARRVQKQLLALAKEARKRQPWYRRLYIRLVKFL